MCRRVGMPTTPAMVMHSCPVQLHRCKGRDAPVYRIRWPCFPPHPLERPKRAPAVSETVLVS